MGVCSYLAESGDALRFAGLVVRLVAPPDAIEEEQAQHVEQTVAVQHCGTKLPVMGESAKR